MSTNEVLFPPGATQRDWVADGILAVTVTLLSIVPYYVQVGYVELFSPLTMFSAAITLPLVLRRHSPLLTLALVSLGGTMQLFFLPIPTISLVSIPIVSYSVARWIPGRMSRSVIVVGAIASVLGPLAWFGAYASNPNADILANLK